MVDNSTYISTDLILDHTEYDQDETILILSGESVDLIEAVAAVAQTVHIYDRSYRTIKRLRHYLKPDNIYIHDTVYPPYEALFDTALLFVPKGRDFGRALLWRALHALKPQGSLYLVGPNKGGAKSLIKDAATLFGACHVVSYKKSHRIAVSIREADDYDFPTEWGTDPTEMQSRTFQTPMGSVRVATLPGIFSWDALDDGTRFLLDNIDFRQAQSVLDVGCGSGIIGTLAAQRVNAVTMLDDNLLAVRCAQATAEHNQLETVDVIASDVYSELSELNENKFDLIICNPPFHQKFQVSTHVPHRIIAGATKHLNAGGRLLMVANDFLRYESVISEHFAQSGTIARNNKYKVLEGVL